MTAGATCTEKRKPAVRRSLGERPRNTALRSAELVDKSLRFEAPPNDEPPANIELDAIQRPVEDEKVNAFHDPRRGNSFIHQDV